MSKQPGKNLVVDWGPRRWGPPPMVQPAQWLMRPWLYVDDKEPVGGICVLTVTFMTVSIPL